MGHAPLAHRAKSSLQFTKFIASLLYGNLSLCGVVVSKSAKVYFYFIFYILYFDVP